MGVIDIPAGEQGTTRVFSLSMSASDARKLRDDPNAQIALLGADTLNPAGIEVFPLSDLGELGLAGYLREGVDARDADLARDRARLAALDGWVLLLHSLAFGGMPKTLDPAPELTLIGTYAQTPPPQTQIELEAEAAQPYTGAPAASSGASPQGGLRGAGLVAGLAVIIAVLLWWAFS